MILITSAFFVALAPGESYSYTVAGRVYTLVYTAEIESNCMYRVTRLGGGVIAEGGIPKGGTLRESIYRPRLTCQEATGLLIADSYIKLPAVFLWLPLTVR